MCCVCDSCGVSDLICLCVCVCVCVGSTRHVCTFLNQSTSSFNKMSSGARKTWRSHRNASLLSFHNSTLFSSYAHTLPVPRSCPSCFRSCFFFCFFDLSYYASSIQTRATPATTERTSYIYKKRLQRTSQPKQNNHSKFVMKKSNTKRTHKLYLNRQKKKKKSHN